MSPPRQLIDPVCRPAATPLVDPAGWARFGGVSESVIAEPDSPAGTWPATSRSTLVAGLACLVLALGAAAAFVVLFNLPYNTMLYSHGLSSDRLLLVAILSFMAMFLASVWLLLPPFVLLFRWPWLRVLVSVLSGGMMVCVLAAWALLVLLSVMMSGGKLHVLASPDGRHTFIITNDSMLPQGNYSVFESTGGVVFHRHGDISTDSGEDFLSPDKSTVRWDRDSVTITYFDLHAKQTHTIRLDSTT